MSQDSDTPKEERHEDSNAWFAQMFGGPLLPAGADASAPVGSYDGHRAVEGGGGYYGPLRGGSVLQPVVGPNGPFNPYAVSAYLTQSACASSQGECALYVRHALERGGINTTGHPVNAGDYASFLGKRGFDVAAEGHGARFNSGASYQPQVGDVVCLQLPGEPGHIAVCCADGTWRSDFKQDGQSKMWGGPMFRSEDCHFTVFRHNSLMNAETLTAETKNAAAAAETKVAGLGTSKLSPDLGIRLSPKAPTALF